jgi:hypothetical protein
MSEIFARRSMMRFDDDGAPAPSSSSPPPPPHRTYVRTRSSTIACERLDASFIVVAAVARAAIPRASSARAVA